jgi:hypothetical protein
MSRRKTIENICTVLGWVEGERKGHFPDIDGAQIQYRIAPCFLLDTYPCIVFATTMRAASLRLDNICGHHVQVRLGTASTFTVLYVFCLKCGTGTSSFKC